MEELKNSNEDIILSNVFIGTKLSCYDSSSDTYLETFGVFEKMYDQTGDSRRKQFNIYKDITSGKYYYLNQNNDVFTPNNNNKLLYTPSNYLISILNLKNIVDITDKIIELYDEKSNVQESLKDLARISKVVNSNFNEAKECGLEVIIKRDNFLSAIDFFILLYCMAFGNPIEKTIESVSAGDSHLETDRQEKIKLRVIKGDKKE